MLVAESHTDIFFSVQQKMSLEIHEYFTLIKHILLKLIVIVKITKSHTKKYDTVSMPACLNYANVFFRDIIGC